MMMKGILSFSQIQNLLFRPFRAKTGHILLLSTYWNASIWLVQYQDKRILFYWIPSHVGIIGDEKADTAAKADLSGRVTNVPIPYGDLKKHTNVLLKRQMAVSVG